MIDTPPRCERCGEALTDEGKIVWLEYNRATDRYLEPGTVPAADSQGCFPFGSGCARKVKKANGENNILHQHRKS